MATRHHGSRGRSAVASASASRAAPRVARRPAIDAATSAVATIAERGGAEGHRTAAELDGRRDHATLAQCGEEEPSADRGEDGTHGSGDGGHHQGLDADQAPGLSWRAADGAQQPDLHAALTAR